MISRQAMCVAESYSQSTSCNPRGIDRSFESESESAENGININICFESDSDSA